MVFKIFLAALVLPFTTIAAPSEEGVEWNENEILHHIGEPNLVALSTNAIPELRVARFSYLPAFGDTIIIRITQRKKHTRARRIIFSRATINDYDWPAEIASIKIPEEQADKLLERAATFFTKGMDSKIKVLNGMDGETWALEFMGDGEYYSTSVWIPKCDAKERNATEFISICERMTKLSGLSPRMDLENESRIELCDPINDDDFEAINLRPSDPLWTKIKKWFND